MDRTENIAMDACSIINLMNVNQLQVVINLPNKRFIIGRAVYAEVSKVAAQKVELDRILQEDNVISWTDEIDISIIANLDAKYNLGDGETEAIAICKGVGCYLCCDDWKARRKAEIEIGSNNVMGCLRLLKLAVEHELIKCTDAEFSFLEMKLKGGFLPTALDDNYFCKAS